MGYTRKTNGSKDAPYGLRADGKPKGKPGRKQLPPRPPRPKKPKSERKKPGPPGRPKFVRSPDNPPPRRIDRGGFKKDGTPMPALLNARGRITKETASAMGKRGGGRPKGSISMDRIIREELAKERGEGREMRAQVLIEKLIEQAISSPIRRGAITRFLTERIDGKAVQPIKDVTPGLRLKDLSDERIAELLAKKGASAMPSPDPIPETHKEVSQPQPSPSPTEERPAEPPTPTDAPPPPKPKKKAGGSGLSA